MSFRGMTPHYQADYTQFDFRRWQDITGNGTEAWDDFKCTNYTREHQSKSALTNFAAVMVQLVI